ncbi:MAG: hypothetical protein JW969_10135 [Spirochaetales bacterium]|nr:hypothetical protein [Spirochaetales bacterium]
MISDEVRTQSNIISEYRYTTGKIDKGYNNRTLYVNVGTGEIREKPVTQMMKDKLIGGKGFGLWYLWNAVTPETRWDDPENEIVISTGPLGGITQYPGAGKSLVVTISPLTGMPMDSNVGGHFGPLLKFAGFDSIELQGKSEEDVIIFIDGNEGIVKIEKSPLKVSDSHLIGEQMAHVFSENEEDKKNVSVVSTGSAAEHAFMGLLNFTFYDARRKKIRMKQAGRGGTGTVFRNKRIKALVVRFRGVNRGLNNPVNQDILNETGVKMHREIHENDAKQNRMREVGTAGLIEIMNAYDLLPTHNFKYGSHRDASKISSEIFKKMVTQNMPDGCWYGCSLSCAKAVDNFELKTGPYKGEKVLVDGPEYENAAGLGANLGIFDPQYVIEGNFYCDTYGIDTISFATTTAFIMECFENGIINREVTGGLDLKFGNREAALELLHQMGRGEGFGKIAGLGVRRLKQIFIEKYGADPGFLNDIGMEQKGLEYSQYLPKESLAQQGGYGLTNKGPQHDEAWLIFMDMVNNQLPTFEDKAEALHYFPMFRTWFGLNGLCKLPWNDIVPADNKKEADPTKVPGHVRNYVSIFYAVTGIQVDNDEIIRQSERVYNLQRIFNVRMGCGRRVNDRVPYRSQGPVTVEEYESRAERYDGQLLELAGFDPEGKTTAEKMAVLRKYREDQYEKLIDAVYERRGWTNNGIPTIKKLKELGMDLPELLAVVEKLQ